jgi:Methionyl-tRNA formyltransferase
MQKKIIFLGSKPIGYHCFAYLLAEKDNLNIEVAGLLTQERKEFGGDSDLTVLAAEHGIPVIENLAEMPECDILYSVQYNRILKQADIDKAKELAVNLHMAPLPEYRGANQFSFAILDEKEEFGTTIHQMDSRIDHGDILFQKRFAIPQDCWVQQLYQLTYDASLRLFKQTLKHIINGQYTKLPQEALISKYGSSLHYKREIADIKEIDPTWKREKINKHIRATMMPGFEPPYILVDGEKHFFTRLL